MPATMNATGRNLLDADLFRQLASRVAMDHDLDIEMAERVIDQTVVFLRACADNPGADLVPSAMVDTGWHTFLLFTREYAAFCQATAGGFIHHEPAESGDLTPAMCSRRLAALEGTGLDVDRMLWAGTDGNCGNSCHRCSGTSCNTSAS